MHGNNINQLFMERLGLNLPIISAQELKDRAEKGGIFSVEPWRQQQKHKHWESEKPGLIELEYILKGWGKTYMSIVCNKCSRCDSFCKVQ